MGSWTGDDHSDQLIDQIARQIAELEKTHVRLRPDELRQVREILGRAKARTVSWRP